MIKLEVWEVEECIEALGQSVLSLGAVLKDMHPAQVLTVKAIQKIISNQEDLAKALQARVWEE